VSLLPLTMISGCGSNRLTSFSPAGTGSPVNARRSLCLMVRSTNGQSDEPGPATVR
jgi:hypothetical protein